MDIVGGRQFVEIPGSETHELPPLLVRTAPGVKNLERVMGMANDLIEQEDILPAHSIESLAQDAEPGWGNFDGDHRHQDPERRKLEERRQLDLERRKMDLAVNLVEQYLGFVQHWQWGDSILEWIRQCETTFDTRGQLRNLLRADLWPHAARSSFVTLLEDKGVETGGVGIEKAVGMRLTFRQPPPLKCFSNQFLFYLNSTVGNTAYQTWADMTPNPISSLPPERFVVNVVDMSLD